MPIIRLILINSRN